MNSTIYKLALIGSLLLLAAHAYPANLKTDAWSLNRCIEQAMSTSSSLKASRWTQHSAGQEYAEMKSQMLPTFSANGSYAYTSETMQLDIPAPPIPGYTPPHIEFGDGNTYDLNLNARIPIYAGGSLRHQANAKKFASHATEFDFQSDSLRLLYNVRRTYFNVAAIETRYDAAQNRVARLQRHLEEIENAKQTGTASEETRLTALAALRAAEGEALRLSAESKAARLQLGNLVGLPESEIQTLGELGSTLITDQNDEAMNRPELAALDNRLAQAETSVKAAKGSFLPTLNGAVTYHYGKPGINQVDNEWMDYYTLGLSASWTLWDFGARSHRVNALNLRSHSIDATRKNAAQSIQTMLTASRTAVETAEPVANKLHERLTLQRDKVRLIEGRMLAGMATESEYLDAQDDLFDAETQWITAQAALRAAEADLLYAMGH